MQMLMLKLKTYTVLNTCITIIGEGATLQLSNSFIVRTKGFKIKGPVQSSLLRLVKEEKSNGTLRGLKEVE